jgi:hypothetical protein
MGARGPQPNRIFFHAPAELAAARDVIERLISRYDLERDPRAVLEAWLELRKRGLQPSEMMLHYLDRLAHQMLRPESEQAKDSPVLELLIAWRGLFGDRPSSAKEAIRQAVSLDLPEAKRLHLALRKIVAETGQPLTPRCLASWLSWHQRRSTTGFSVSSAVQRNHVTLWKVTTKS